METHALVLAPARGAEQCEWVSCSARILGVVMAGCVACAGTPRAGEPSPISNGASSAGALVVAPPPAATARTEPPSIDKAPTSPVDEGEVRFCSFQGGQITTCRSYSGVVNLFDEGAWMSCRVTLSRVTHCIGPANGRVVVFTGSSFEECVVSNGSLGPCTSFFTGSAPLARPH
ncbi:MAG: hypothetical protein U0174_06935 [Polyangiaceae bacterium]